MSSRAIIRPCQLSESAILKLALRAECLAKRMRHREWAKDFSHDVVIELLSGRHASIDLMWIDFLRKTHGSRHKQEQWKTFNKTPITEPTQESITSVEILKEGRSLKHQEIMTLISQGFSQLEIAKHYGVHPSRVVQWKEEIRQSFARTTPKNKRCLDGLVLSDS